MSPIAIATYASSPYLHRPLKRERGVMGRSAMKYTHPPGSRRKDHVAHTATPELERLAVFGAKRPHRRSRAKPQVTLVAADCEGRVATALRLDTRGAIVGRDRHDPLDAEEGATLLPHLRMYLPFQPQELVGDVVAKARRAVLFDARRQRERERRFLGPGRVFRVEVHLGTLRVHHAPAQLGHGHLGARPFARAGDEAGGHGVREDVGDLLHDGGAGREAYDARGAAVPEGAFPGAEHLRAERDEAIEEMQELRQDAEGIAHDEVQMVHMAQKACTCMPKRVAETARA